MKKFITVFASVAMMGLLLTGCGGSGDSKEITAAPAELAKNLAATSSDNSLTEVSAEILASTYMVDAEKIEDSSAYMGAGSTACEAVVIKCTDDSYPAEVKTLLETRVQNQSDLYASYNAAQVEILDDAIIKVSGNYAVLCVTDDTDAAEKVLEEAGF